MSKITKIEILVNHKRLYVYSYNKDIPALQLEAEFQNALTAQKHTEHLIEIIKSAIKDLGKYYYLEGDKKLKMIEQSTRTELLLEYLAVKNLDKPSKDDV